MSPVKVEKREHVRIFKRILDCESLEDIGQSYGITKARVSMIFSALRKKLLIPAFFESEEEFNKAKRCRTVHQVRRHSAIWYHVLDKIMKDIHPDTKQQKIQESLDKYGYVIQSVLGGGIESSCLYTFGRSAFGKPDIFINNAPTCHARLIQECVKIVDAGYDVTKVYESTQMVMASNPQDAAKFKIREVDPIILKDVAPQIFEYAGTSTVRVLEVVLANKDNSFV